MSSCDCADCTARRASAVLRPVGELLTTDEARMALWEAIRSIRFGNPTDDKLIVAALAGQGVYLARLTETQRSSNANGPDEKNAA